MRGLTVLYVLTSQSSSQEIRLGSISENVCERPSSFDQSIWTVSDVGECSKLAPKVPGSRPGRPTKSLITEEGMKLREAAPAFVGRHVIPRYRGYMQGQALKLLGLKGSGGHGRRGGAGRQELIQEHGFDTKYAMHCARLGFQCRELLTTGKLTLPIQHDYADWLRELRGGHVSFGEWWETVLDLDATLEAMESDESLPIGPDKGAIESLSVNIHLSIWESQEARRRTGPG